MPFIKDYTDAAGGNRPLSCWRLSTININDLGRVIQFAFGGFPAETDVENQPQLLGSPKQYETNDPNVYKTYAVEAKRTDSAFFAALEDLALATDAFFTGALRLALVTFSAAEVGSVSETILVLDFFDDVNSPTSQYALGITILVNDGIVAISAAVLQAGNRQIQYTIPAVLPGQRVQIWYQRLVGNLRDVNSRPLASWFGLTVTGADNVTSTTGGYLRFDSAINSGHIPARIF